MGVATVVAGLAVASVVLLPAGRWGRLACTTGPFCVEFDLRLDACPVIAKYDNLIDEERIENYKENQSTTNAKGPPTLGKVKNRHNKLPKSVNSTLIIGEWCESFF